MVTLTSGVSSLPTSFSVGVISTSKSIMESSPKAKNPGSLPPLTRSKFFFDDSMINIQIESMQFRVHRSKLMKPETFVDMFTVAENSNNGENAMEGSSPNHPIKLEGVRASDFECLLTFLYEKHRPKTSDIKPSLVVPAFRLAHMWNFTELRANLLPLLERALDDVDKIVYAREFNIEDWENPAYIRLYRRSEPLTSQEVEKLGFTTAMLIFRLREEKYTAAYQQCCGEVPEVQSVDVRLQTRCKSCGHRKDMNGNVTDKAIEERIHNWEKSGRIF